MKKTEIYINCKKCNGTGVITETIFEQGTPVGHTDTVCTSCDEGLATLGKINPKLYTDIMDELAKILAKCNDIYNKVNV